MESVLYPYFNDPLTLVRLEYLLPPQITDLNPKETRKDLINVEEVQDQDEDDVVEISKPPVATPRKRRANKLREPMDEQFLRRSKRNAEKLDGFKDMASVKEAALTPQPLAIIPVGNAFPVPTSL